jgi:3-methyladenine DNA glycosylase AlkD
LLLGLRPYKITIMKNIINEIQKALIESADDKTKGNSQHFFKEKIMFHGVKTPLVSQIAKHYFKEIPFGKKAIFSYCEELFRTGYLEEALIACEWSYWIKEEYQPEDFQIFENWINRYIANWATCDTLCNHALGDFVTRYPTYVNNLKSWARSENRWFRRAAAVTLILPARQGEFLKEIFEIAYILLLDKDDLVQKGYGWLLKETSKKHLVEVHDYIMVNKKVMPRTALRYAIEKMPENLKRAAMAR